jgi:ATP-binding cassette subfamily B protein
VRDLRSHVFAHLLTMPMSFFHRTSLGRLISRVTNDIDSIRLGIQDSLFIGIVQLGTMVGAATLMALFDLRLFLVVLALVPILWGLLRHFHGRLYRAHSAMQESFSRVTTTLTETVGGIRVIQGFGRQEHAKREFRELIYDHSRYNLQVAEQNALFGPLLELNGQLFLALLLVIGGWQALHGDVRVGALIQFFFLANLFFGPIPILAQQYNQALAAMAGAERVFRLLDAKRDWEDAPDAIELPPAQGRVEFRNVTFGYDPERPVLHDVSFIADAGQTVAIVGETGGGKSTLLALIGKLYLPKSGQVLVDGHDLMRVTRKSLRRQMSIVQQNNFLWTGSVLENIRFGRPDATEADVRDAAAALGVIDLLDDLPDGLDTQVGERGASLSLGQRQIVCFTRAMLAGPRILLLDEATSAIDTVTEARLQGALRRLVAGRTTFIVAHRLSTIRHADQVLVVSGGRIVERGRYAELVRAGGVFAQLHRRGAA